MQFVIENLKVLGNDADSLVCFYYGKCAFPPGLSEKGHSTAEYDQVSLSFASTATLIEDGSLEKQIEWVSAVFGGAAPAAIGPLFAEWKALAPGTSPLRQKHRQSIEKLEQFTKLGLDTHIRNEVRVFLTRKYLFKTESEEDIRARVRAEASPHLFFKVSLSETELQMLGSDDEEFSDRNLDRWAAGIIRKIFRETGRAKDQRDKASEN